MKKKAKKALKHDVEILGKSVPVVAIAALFLVGGTSAALLTTYGTVEGTAEVDQAIVFGSEGESEGTTTLTTFDSEDSEVVAGSSYVDTAYLVNNLDETATVDFNSTQSFNPSSEDAEDASGNVEGLRTGFLAFNGLNSTVSGATETADSASVSYVVDEGDQRNRPAVHLNVDKESTSGTANAGIKFDVNEQFTGDNSISIDYREGSDHFNDKVSPDWIFYNVTAESDSGDVVENNNYVVADVTVDESTGTSLTWDDESTFGNGNTLVYEVGSADSVSVSNLKDNAVINQVKVATGTSGDDHSSEIYLYGVEFAGDDLLRAIPHSTSGEDGGVVSYDVPPGNHTVKAVNEIDVAAYPGQYTVSAEALP